MFTGIVEELGEVKKISRRGAVTLFEIKADKTLSETKIGESISVNGACLTVVQIGKDSFSFEVMPETLKVTNLGILRINEKVNLERSLKIGDRVSGHFVLGHIDCLGIIRKKGIVSGNLGFEIVVPVKFIKYCLLKGSIAIDGISLTIADKKSNTFMVYIIPHTLKNTTLSFKGPSDKVNIEFDMLAKK
ncbi:MAG: riboflavin synthase [Candidatus Omnitrophica bacterium CG08_land_8_20_14_0_20_41_16]|uniref:Riboflavin synthase n=1 Tax=Candidatus Sherwoodlollariibacterium unditelluris TaxID=1974757 RepID=A0A2G9YJJ7_9BACT|nr:MAG: riboflavin synthase [Candidatus Omnitrophica bacterium CG23_combo_of_CG06-09_8_20_14_all_41_10]PIS33535.1 MAG: riboflavin synthase [Candidatus Omnitrophica bacterium CG08_land_8_20_14_0_20_41_16]